MKDYKTWNEWKEEGASVVKGQKSHMRDENGNAVFHVNQTDYRRNQRRFSGGGFDPHQGAQDLIDDGVTTLAAFDIGADF